MSDLHAMVYVSSATGHMSAGTLHTILESSRIRNRAAEVSGLLLYADGNIIQCLEGPPAAVSATFARISRDPRHHGIFVIFNEAVAARSFQGWDMAWLEVDTTSFAAARRLLTEPQPGSILTMLLAEFWRNSVHF